MCKLIWARSSYLQLPNLVKVYNIVMMAGKSEGYNKTF